MSGDVDIGRLLSFQSTDSSKVTIDDQGPVSDEEEAKHKYKALANTRAEDWKLPPPGDPR